MALHKYDLVNTNGLKGLHFEGRDILFSEIDDGLAAKLDGKTHVLKKKTPAAATRALTAAAAATTEQVDK